MWEKLEHAQHNGQMYALWRSRSAEGDYLYAVMPRSPGDGHWIEPPANTGVRSKRLAWKIAGIPRKPSA